MNPGWKRATVNQGPEGPSALEVQRKGMNNNLNFIQTLGVISLKEHQRGGSIFLIHCKMPSKCPLHFCPQYSCRNRLLISKTLFFLHPHLPTPNSLRFSELLFFFSLESKFHSPPSPTTNPCFSSSVLSHKSESNSCSAVSDSTTQWTVAHRARLSTKFCREGYWGE